MTVTESDFDKLYGSKYLSASDLNGEQRRAKIKSVLLADLREKDGTTKKMMAVHFDAEDKPLILNKTNAVKLHQAFGKAPTNWVGNHVELYTETTQFGDGVRVRPLRKPATPESLDPDLNDSLPTFA
jgi:hypothetical protein